MKLKTKNGKEYIFDLVRKKYVRNQPEEWVRQNIVEYLNKEKGYPISLMSVEKKTQINYLTKRCDIICYNKHGNPILLVECKAPNITLNKDTFNQSINYQKVVQAKYIMITNGKTHYCFTFKNEKIKFLKTIPNYVNSDK
tara:strand:+ start:143 stop:562 length:420 start_codon:yes stop_codon:yes gene_type:complete